jgi:hypothetical protein
MTELGDWTSRLVGTLAITLRELPANLEGFSIALLAVDCLPWHGTIGLAALTATEIAADPELADPTEMAAWLHYGLSDRLAAWQSAAVLGEEMRFAYESAADPPRVAEAFLRACARAVAHPEVLAAAQRLNLTADFRFTVTHPDDGREFVAGSLPKNET